MKREELAKPVLRIALALVFLYFGFSQVINPDAWVGFVPENLVPANLTANNLVMANAILELCLGIFMIIGLYTRFSSIILAIHLIGIASSLGFTPLGVRDFGLCVATLVVYLNGADALTVDAWFKRKV